MKLRNINLRQSAWLPVRTWVGDFDRWRIWTLYNRDLLEAIMIRPMSYYRYHLFFCTNQREDGSNCCGRFGAQKLRDYAKGRCKELGLVSNGSVRVNSAGCLNRCEKGPLMVIYPEETWYRYVDQADVDEIIDSHLCNGEVVERLLIPNS